MSFLEGLIKVLGVVFILVAIIGIVAPSLFKDKKTEKVPKRSDFLMGGAVSATIAFIVAVWISPDKASSEVVEEITHRVSLPNPSHETVAAPHVTNHESHTSELQKTLNLSEARLFARNALRIINETEQALNDGIQLGDTAGITKYVLKPLRSELALWPNLGLPPKDQRKHFEHCRQALTLLNGLAFNILSERTVENMKYVRKYETEYQDSKERCEKQLNATDSEIIAAIEAEDNELKKKLGGRDCLTIISGIDKKTGKPIEEPKPLHCKNSPTTPN